LRPARPSETRSAIAAPADTDRHDGEPGRQSRQAARKVATTNPPYSPNLREANEIFLQACCIALARFVPETRACASRNKSRKFRHNPNCEQFSCTRRALLRRSGERPLAASQECSFLWNQFVLAIK
jgi:hypothetical protein